MTEPSQYFKGRTVQEQMNEVIGYVDVRSAEVAVDAIADDMATIHQDKLDAEAAATNAAASAAAAAGTLANAVKKTGEASQSINGDIDLNDDLNVDGNATVGGALAVTGAVTVPAPVNNTDAATKKYVDDADALKLSITDVNSYALGLTGNQAAAGLKFIYAPYYVGSPPVASGGDSDDYIDLANLGSVANGGNVTFAATSRYGVAIGGFTIDSTGVPTFQGTVSTSAQRTSIGITVIDGNMHLVAKRTASVAQTITMMIFGCSRGAGYTALTPAVTYQTINIANADYNEGVQL